MISVIGPAGTEGEIDPVNDQRVMKTILCPVDFSPYSDGVSRYASQLARDVNAKVVLIAASPVRGKVPAGDWTEDRGEADNRLDELRDQVKATYRIPCGKEDDVIINNIYKRLGLVADNYDLTVVGMKWGKDRVRRNGAELNLVKMIQESLAPLVIIPERTTYKKINRILYAYDYRHEPEPPLLQLNWLSAWLGAKVKFVSIIQTNTSVSEHEKINSMHREIAGQWRSKTMIEFETIVSDDAPRALEHYLDMRRGNDLLVLSVNHRNILERAWHKSVVKHLLKTAQYPFLILHK